MPATTIEELFFALGLDASAFSSDVASASKELDVLAASGARVQTAFAGVETVTAGVSEALAPIAESATVAKDALANIVGPDAEKAAKSIGAAFLKVGSGLGVVQQRVVQVSGALGGVDAAGRSAAGGLAAPDAAAIKLGRNLGILAIQGNLGAGGILNLVTAGTQLAAGFAGSATQLQKVDSALTAAAIAASPVGKAFSAIGTAVLGIAPAFLPIGAAFALFQTMLGSFVEQVKKQTAELDKFFAGAAAGAAALKGVAASVQAELDNASVQTFADQTELLVENLNKSAEAGRAAGQFISQGFIDSEVATIRTTRAQLAYKLAMNESQAAAKLLGEETRAATAAAQAELAKLQKSLQVAPAAETLAALKALGTALDFTGPLADLQSLQAELTATKTRIEELGEVQGLDSAEIAKQVKAAQDALKQGFKDKIAVELAIDTDAAEKDAQKALQNIASLAPPKTSLVFDPNTLASLLASRSTILSQIAAAPSAVLKLQAQADLAQVDADIAAERAKQEADAVTLTVDADTGPAAAAIAALQAQADRVAVAMGRVASGNFSITGNAASQADIAEELRQMRLAVVGAIQSADAQQLAALSSQIQAGDPFVLAAEPGFGFLQAQITQALQALGTSAAAQNTSLGNVAGALQSLQQQQADDAAEAAALLQESNDIAKGQLAATQQGTTAINSPAISTAIQSRTRSATGVRSASFGG